MDNNKRWELFNFVLECERYSRKPHRKAPVRTTLATDLARIVKLSSRRHMIATRFCDGVEQSTDEVKEERIIEKLTAIGLRYGWSYESKDGGLSAHYKVAHADLSIQIPLWEN